MDTFAMFEQADDYILGREDEADFEWEDECDGDWPFLEDDDEHSEFGFDPYAGDFLDEDPIDPYEFYFDEY